MNKYIVLEIQSNSDGTVGTLITSHDDRSSAESKFHSVLASAAISDVMIHSCIIMNDEGFVYDNQSYTHGETGDA